jgi:hypothetical protein
MLPLPLLFTRCEVRAYKAISCIYWATIHSSGGASNTGKHQINMTASLYVERVVQEARSYTQKRIVCRVDRAIPNSVDHQWIRYTTRLLVTGGTFAMLGSEYVCAFETSITRAATSKTPYDSLLSVSRMRLRSSLWYRAERRLTRHHITLKNKF